MLRLTSVLFIYLFTFLPDAAPRLGPDHAFGRRCEHGSVMVRSRRRSEGGVRCAVVPSHSPAGGVPPRAGRGGSGGGGDDGAGLDDERRRARSTGAGGTQFDCYIAVGGGRGGSVQCIGGKARLKAKVKKVVRDNERSQELPIDISQRVGFHSF